MRAMSMTSRERVVAAMNRGVPDRVPRDISWGIAPAVFERFKRETGTEDFLSWFKVDTRHINQGPTRRQTDFSRYFGPGVTWGEWGIGMESTPDSQHFTHIVSPLRNAVRIEEIADYPLPDLDADYRLDAVAGEVRKVHDQGLAAAAPLAVTIYEVAWQVRGLEPMLTDMLERPELADCLYDRITEIRLAQTRAYVKAGCDVLMYGDDVSCQTGMIMSPATWRRFFKPRMARLIAEARSIAPRIPVFYHSDGDPRAIVDDLIEIGVTILNPVQPECMDPAEMKRRYGDRISFWGTIGIQHTLPFGSVDDVRREVKLRMDTVGKGGGLLLGPSHMIEPEVPWENIVALYGAIDEYGVYR
jgi:uroporphyrinogen decarboxylase